jgi:hypothetical protein
LISAGTGCGITQVDGLGGVVKLNLDGNADNDQAVMQAGNSAGGLFLMAGSAPKELIFEARAKVSTVTASVMSVFLGLAEAGSATTVLPITASDALGDKNMIGFHRLGTVTTALSFGYKADGQTAVNKGTVGTLAADTWFKVGFRYSELAGTITPWFNGLEVPSLKITKAAWALATAPCDAYLHAVAGVISSSSNAAANMQIDWIRVGQVA